MARTAYAAHQGYIGMPGVPVEMVDQYAVSDNGSSGSTSIPSGGPVVDFASYSRRIPDLMPQWQAVSPDATPFEATSVSQSQIMMFNITNYGQALLNEFLKAGGQYQRADFQSPAEIAALGKKVVINCTGYGARALWRDDTLVPVRGQLAHLVPQPNVHYGVIYQRVLAVPRRDGIVVQSFEGGEAQGYGIADETPDRGEAEQAVMMLAELFSPPRWRGSGPQALLAAPRREAASHVSRIAAPTRLTGAEPT
jgi:hypothetical protein